MRKHPEGEQQDPETEQVWMWNDRADGRLGGGWNLHDDRGKGAAGLVGKGGSQVTEHGPPGRGAREHPRPAGDGWEQTNSPGGKRKSHSVSPHTKDLMRNGAASGRSTLTALNRSKPLGWSEKVYRRKGLPRAHYKESPAGRQVLLRVLPAHKITAEPWAGRILWPLNLTTSVQWGWGQELLLPCKPPSLSWPGRPCCLTAKDKQFALERYALETALQGPRK